MINEAIYLQTFDELNNLTTEKLELPQDEFKEWVEGVLLLAYMQGAESAADDLQTEAKIDIDKVGQALNLRIDGKTYADRIDEYLIDGTEGEIKRVVETEYHRMFNTGGYDTASKSGGLKEWVTVGDDKVRATHRYLENTQVPIDTPFFTFDGDSAFYPGGFTSASNNIGCRCVLKYING